MYAISAEPKNPPIKPSTVFLGESYHRGLFPKNLPPNNANVSFIVTNNMSRKNQISPLYIINIPHNPEIQIITAERVQKNAPI